MPTFNPDDLKTLSTTLEVDIQPTRANGELGRRKTIWLVVDGDHAYIRSVRGTDGAWYKAARASSAAVLHAGATSWPIQLELVTDPDQITRVSDALSRKYGQRWQQSTAAMLRDEVLSATLRLTPS